MTHPRDNTAVAEIDHGSIAFAPQHSETEDERCEFQALEMNRQSMSNSGGGVSDVY